MYDVRENEHQELFSLRVDPRQPIAMHIPSPLGRLRYYLYVRVPRAAVERLAGVASHLVVGGLRPDDVLLAPGEGAPGAVIIPSKDAGFAWRCLGCAAVSRGNGTLTLLQWPAEVAEADLLICTWPRFVESGMADDWLAAQADPAWAPSGVPLGGIGGGRVDLCRDGRFRNFSMNNNQDAPLEDPAGLHDAYLAVETDGVVTDLASRPIIAGHRACPALRYTPRFPQATLGAEVGELAVTVTASGTLSPHNLRYSSIPGLLVRWEVTNTGAAAREVRCAMGWPNLIGIGGGRPTAESGIGYGDGFYHQWDDSGGRAETATVTADAACVRYTGTPAAAYFASAGEHLLGVTPGQVAAQCGDGRGEVSVTLTVPPGGHATATMALVTAMPHWIDSLEVDRGHLWQTYFADGEAMLAVLLAEADAIFAETGALAALLDDSTLPEWLRQRLSNCCYPLVTNSVLYRDGRFSINEGPTEMAGCYGTIDQRLAAHPATQLLFPQLNAVELALFGNIQGANGGICHDLGAGHLEREPGEQEWPDLTCSFIIQTARHAWSTGDAAFEAAMWTRARAALLRHAEWAEDGDGVAQVGDGLGTSYDGYHYIGTTGYMATLWLAALAVAERWAHRMGDTALPADIARWRAAAVRRLEADLWNGQYYIAYGSLTGPRRETCHAGQLAGQVFARQYAGQDVLDAARLRSCLDALLTLNGGAQFVTPPDEVAPDGTAAVEFGWLPYVEGFMLTAAATLHDPRLPALWQRIITAMDDNNTRPCDTRLMYRPETGEPSWGAYYMTAPASWLVYEAQHDFCYQPEDGALRLHTAEAGRIPLVHPLFWATAEIAGDGQVTLTIRRVFSERPLTIATLETPADAPAIAVAGQPLPAEPGPGSYVRYRLPEPVTLREGAEICWRVK